MRTCVILNPAAGGSNAADRVRRALRLLPGAELREIPLAGAAGCMAAAAVEEGFERVVAAGGDGTVSEIASALLSTGETVQCGVVPIGTGNDLALSLGLPVSVHGAVSVLVRGEATPVDAIRVADGSSFAWNAVVAGFGGRISDRMSSRMKRRWKRAAYLRAALGELADLRPRPVGLTVDGRSLELDLLMLVLANGSHAGGGIPFAPGAVVDDGWIDVIAIPAVPRWRLPEIVGRVLAGRHLGVPGLLRERGRRIRVDAGPGFWYNIDGETWRDGGARFELVPHALPFIRPSG